MAENTNSGPRSFSATQPSKEPPETIKDGSEGPAGKASIGDNEALEAWPRGSTLEQCRSRVGCDCDARGLAEAAMLARRQVILFLDEWRFSSFLFRSDQRQPPSPIQPVPTEYIQNLL